MSSKTPFKRGAKVYFRGRARDGYGKIVNVQEGGRGVWYEVKAEDGYTIKVRAANLELV